ncbi:MAG TPA: phosphoribosyltransferase family protein [Longimicrobiales bacterium]|nr:phosphoribosyltransferase family protein [Longimicrobiales bacterium]
MQAGFEDRAEAGRKLAERLRRYANRPDVVVLALPRGGVPVGYEVARELNAPLDVFLVRKLGAPGQPELAMGALASGGTVVLNYPVIHALGIPREAIDQVAEEERRELSRREEAYRGHRPPTDLKGRTVILVDDGLATGSSMRAAVEAVRQRGPARIIVAVPVAARETCEELRREVDEAVCLETPDPFYAVGFAYRNFEQTSDEEVRRLLAEAATPAVTGAGTGASAPAAERSVTIDAAGVRLEGDLVVPPNAHGVVLFAHGSGSSRHSPRNRHVAAELQDAGLGTLLLDLLTADEEAIDIHTAHLRFDIPLLAERLVGAIDWLAEEPTTRELPRGLFGASTGAAAALVAAAARPERVGAIVSRGGRPDLAGDALPRVRAPTLLIVGGLDYPVIALNQEALARMQCEKELVIVPGATHLFEEPGTLDEVSRLAREWFLQHLRR